MLRASLPIRFVAGLLAAFLASELTSARAETPRVLPAGKTPADKRLEPLKNFDSYFPFEPYSSREAWEKRAEQLRRQLKMSLGLWPMPTAMPANAVVHGKVERDGYTVERVSLESYPGHFVTGSLFRPVGKTGKLPGVLCPHGHWANGRFYAENPQRVREQIVQGAERFEIGGRYPLQARCVQLARMGCVVFHYDMIGYADSKQISYEVAHRINKPRPQMEGPDSWGYFTPQAELRFQSIMGLQSYNSVRALDWFSALPDVDPARIGVTGASGGGTQTFILAAIDPRPTVAFPAVMVSTAMQGGCTCENCDYLRIGTGNIELAALFAPKPLGMTAADDWTKEIATKGLPQLKQHFELLGAKDNVMAKPLLQYPHNYNYVSRAVMYSWMNKHFKLGLPEPIVEEDYKPLSIEELTVWDKDHPAPPSGEDEEKRLLKWVTEDADKQIAALLPKDAASLAKYREVIGGAVDAQIGRTLPPAGSVTGEKLSEDSRDSYILYKHLLRNTKDGSELPTIFLFPKNWNKQVAVWIDDAGTAGLFTPEGTPKPAIERLLKAGVAVTGVDLIYQGEFLADGKPLTATREVPNNRAYAGFTHGYNYSVFAQRVHDILSVLSFVVHHEDKPEKVHLIGLGGAGPLVAFARAQAGDAVAKTALDTAGFRFAKLTRYTDPNFIPGGAKYGDLPGAIALCAPYELWLAGETQMPAVVSATYQSAGAAGKLQPHEGPAEGRAAAVVDWMLK